MEYFRVVNLDKYQHYKDRRPPWIKLHRSILDDYDHTRLPDASKWHLAMIWMLASALDNKIPYDDDWITQQIHATTKTNLNLLLSMDFIEMLAPCLQEDTESPKSAMPETETYNKEKEKEEISHHHRSDNPHRKGDER